MQFYTSKGLRHILRILNVPLGERSNPDVLFLCQFYYSFEEMFGGKSKERAQKDFESGRMGACYLSLGEDLENIDINDEDSVKNTLVPRLIQLAEKVEDISRPALTKFRDFSNTSAGNVTFDLPKRMKEM